MSAAAKVAGGATPGSFAEKVAGGATPGSFGLTMGWLLDRTLGSDPVHRGSSVP
jgi:hypothetical protein